VIDEFIMSVGYFCFYMINFNSSNLMSIIAYGYGILRGVLVEKKLRVVFYLRAMVVERRFPDHKH